MIDMVRQECVAVWGEAGTAEMEAHCSANGMTLADFLEAVATKPGGACDQFGMHVDEATGPRLASILRQARMLEDVQTLQIALSGDVNAMFKGPEGGA